MRAKAPYPGRGAAPGGGLYKKTQNNPMQSKRREAMASFRGARQREPGNSKLE
jgi:hypothetical protein